MSSIPTNSSANNPINQRYSSQAVANIKATNSISNLRNAGLLRPQDDDGLGSPFSSPFASRSDALDIKGIFSNLARGLNSRAQANAGLETAARTGFRASTNALDADAVLKAAQERFNQSQSSKSLESFAGRTDLGVSTTLAATDGLEFIDELAKNNTKLDIATTRKIAEALIEKGTELAGQDENNVDQVRFAARLEYLTRRSAIGEVTTAAAASRNDARASKLDPVNLVKRFEQALISYDARLSGGGTSGSTGSTSSNTSPSSSIPVGPGGTTTSGGDPKAGESGSAGGTSAPSTSTSNSIVAPSESGSTPAGDSAPPADTPPTADQIQAQELDSVDQFTRLDRALTADETKQTLDRLSNYLGKVADGDRTLDTDRVASVLSRLAVNGYSNKLRDKAEDYAVKFRDNDVQSDQFAEVSAELTKALEEGLLEEPSAPAAPAAPSPAEVAARKRLQGVRNQTTALGGTAAINAQGVLNVNFRGAQAELKVESDGVIKGTLKNSDGDVTFQIASDGTLSTRKGSGTAAVDRELSLLVRSITGRETSTGNSGGSGRLLKADSQVVSTGNAQVDEALLAAEQVAKDSGATVTRQLGSTTSYSTVSGLGSSTFVADAANKRITGTVTTGGGTSSFSVNVASATASSSSAGGNLLSRAAAGTFAGTIASKVNANDSLLGGIVNVLI